MEAESSQLPFLLKRLPQLLLEEGLCASKDEAEIIATAALQDCGLNLSLFTAPSTTINQQHGPQNVQSHPSKDIVESHQELVKVLQLYVGLDSSDCELLIKRCLDPGNEPEEEVSGSDSDIDDEDRTTLRHLEPDRQRGDEDEDFFVQDGECELCERGDVRLTRHHLIPKSTWPRVEKKLLASYAKDGAHSENHLLSHLLSTTTISADNITQRTVRDAIRKSWCLCCRPCHSAVHRTHDNMTLASEYYSVKRLLQDEAIRKFAQWAHKQRAGKNRR